jgi:hypothetical protein
VREQELKDKGVLRQDDTIPGLNRVAGAAEQVKFKEAQVVLLLTDNETTEQLSSQAAARAGQDQGRRLTPDLRPTSRCGRSLSQSSLTSRCGQSGPRAAHGGSTGDSRRRVGTGSGWSWCSEVRENPDYRHRCDD